MVNVSTIFTKDDAKISIGLRKVCIKKFPLKKSPGKYSTLYYLPIHKDEVQQLGLTEGSLVKAEISVFPKRENIVEQC